MFCFEENSPVFPPDIMKAFQEGKAKDILSKYLYDYRNHTDDESFHFLIGLCLFHMGYYEEAHVAFCRSQKECRTGSHRGDVFDALTMIMAQKDKEASEKLKKIPLDSLTPSETVTVMSIKQKLGQPVEDELARVLHAKFQTEADRLVMSLFAYKYASDDESARNTAGELDASLFQDFGTYAYVVAEIYKLRMEEEADAMLEKVPVPWAGESAERFMQYIDACYSCGYYNRMDKSRRAALLGLASKEAKKSSSQGRNQEEKEWKKNLSSLYCMEYDRMESLGSEEGKASLIEKMRASDEKSEKMLLYIATFSFEHFDLEKAAELKEIVEKLVSMNQTSRQYRKLYCNLLIVMGCLHQADNVAKATVQMRKRLEAEEFSLVSSFRSFYMRKSCMLKYMPVHKKDDGKDCPICFGSGSKPIIRSIGFGHSPSSIFTDNLEKSVIGLNEEMLRDLVNWQPMNVASPIVAKYLLSLGAYMSVRDYPDVLVPGQTYLYLSLKPEAERRLREEGYSLLQIDPFAVAMDMKGSSEDQECKSLDLIPVSAKDFTLEVIHAISPQKDLDNAPEMPMPEKYVPEED